MNRRTVIAAGAALAVPGAARAAGWDAAKLETAADLMGEWTNDGRVQGASILVEQGARRFMRNLGTARGAEPVFLLASITKPMTAAAVMTLVDAGEIRLEDSATKYFPRFTGEGREAITIRNLLTHTGGLPDMLANDEALRARHAPLAEYRDEAFRAPLKFAPGTSYSYSSMGILLASEIARKVTGTPFAQFVEDKVFRPLEMNRTTLGLRGRANNQTVASQAAPALTEAGKRTWPDWQWNSAYWRNLGAPWGGALGPASDIARFYREFLDQRGRILKPMTEQMMIVNQSPPGVKASGLGFDLPPSVGSPACGPRTFGHNGSTGTLSWADPGSGTICVILTTLYQAAVKPHPAQLSSDLIARAVQG
jgi:CubicO group peptidase (beta-lactamase class C family)